MKQLVMNLVDLSITASFLVLVILLARLLLKNTPRWLICSMWALVALRLILPFSIESPFSLIPATSWVLNSETISLGSETNSLMGPVSVPSEIAIALNPDTSINKMDIGRIFFVVWALGLIGLLTYAFLSWLRLRKNLADATIFSKGIKQSEKVPFPFVAGVFRPVIYLPYQIGEDVLEQVIAHEQSHIHRKDHWWKLLGFLILSIYWFNPLLWIAYHFLCKDIESACDERVIRRMNLEQRKKYSTALLNVSLRYKKNISLLLAFGELNVKERIQGIMSYHEPSIGILSMSFVLFLTLAVCFLTNPQTASSSNADKVDYDRYVEEAGSEGYLEETHRTAEMLQEEAQKVVQKLEEQLREEEQKLAEQNRAEEEARRAAEMAQEEAQKLAEQLREEEQKLHEGAISSEASE